MKYVLTLLASIAITFAQQGALPAGVAVGDRAPDFRLKNVDGRMVGLSDYAALPGVVVIFTCNHCPYSVKYEDRIIALFRETTKLGYQIVAINPNDPVRVPEDSFENMKERAKEKLFPFPYLVDETQEIAKAYGAKKTPHVFVVSFNNGTPIVRYIGAIDDNAMNPEQVESQFVLDAVKALAAGSNPKLAETKAIGCSIKWKE